MIEPFTLYLNTGKGPLKSYDLIQTKHEINLQPRFVASYFLNRVLIIEPDLFMILAQCLYNMNYYYTQPIYETIVKKTRINKITPQLCLCEYWSVECLVDW